MGPDRIDRFEIRRLLGEGGMGVVYEAFDSAREVTVALKTLRHVAPRSLLGFKNEFRSLQDIHHDNLVRLGELIERDGQWFFTMELLAGTDFLNHVRPGIRALPEGLEPTLVSTGDSPGDQTELVRVAGDPAHHPLDEQRLRAALPQLVAGLEALHDAGKIHRDIKPSNIRVTPSGRVVLVDFGLIAEVASRPEVVEGMGFAGTAAYSAPEQAGNDPLGVAADWYGVGVVLYEALTGQLPFTGNWLHIIATKQRQLPAPPGDDAPEDLAAICMDLLQIDPAERLGGAQLRARLGLAGEPGRRSSRRHTLVGRERERALLERALDDSRAGAGVTVYVRGDSGIGKSALVASFAARYRSAARFAGRCYERESVPYKAFDGVLDALSEHYAGLPDADIAALVPREAGLLVQLFPVLGRVRAIERSAREVGVRDPTELRVRAFGALREMFRRLAERHPVIVILDDLQWADADSLLLLRALVRQPDAPAILMVIAAREPLQSIWDALELRRVREPLVGDVRAIELAPLDDAAALALASARLEAAGVSSAGAAALATEAHNHPLYIDELVRHAVTSGPSRPAAPRLDDAIWHRVSRLEPGAVATMELVAVAGAPIARAAIAAASGLAPAALDEHVARLRAANLISGVTTADRLEPYHDRVREAVVGAIAADRRRAHHRALADALDTVGSADQPDLLLRHLEAAGDLARAAVCAEDAARRAMKALAFTRAARLYAQALELGAYASDRRRALLIERGDALAYAGRGGDAAEAYTAAIEGAPAGLALDLRHRAADQWLRSGNVDRGSATMRDVLAAVGVPFPRTPRRALLSLIRARVRIKRRGFAHRIVSEADIAADVLARVDACWSAGRGLSMVSFVHGAYLQARHLVDALDAGEPRRLARAFAHEASILASQGAQARERVDYLVGAAAALADGLDDPRVDAWILGTRAVVAFFDARWAQAYELFERADNLLRTRCTGIAWERTTVQLFTHGALFYLGRARDLARRAPLEMSEARSRGDLYADVSLRTAYGNLAWVFADDPDTAWAEASDALSRWSRDGFLLQHWYGMRALGQIALYRGDPAHGFALLRERWRPLMRSLLSRNPQVSIEAHQLRARCALALAAGGEGGARALRTAARDANKIARQPGAWPAALAVLLRAGVAACRDDRGHAADLLVDAARRLDALDMKLYAAAARMRRAQCAGPSAAVAGADAETWMRQQGIAAPGRLAAMLVPGFGTER